jgi:hypothetical protein
VATHAGEVPVNPGADPGRDDSGLPPVDIEIPDDARELDRDVIAYRRERRAMRRRARLQRVLRPVRGHGTILPLIASCVALSMLAGVMLSVFTISPASAPVGGPDAASSGAAPSASASTAPLPSGSVLVDGKPTPLHQLAGAVLVLVPAGCKCDTALKQLTAQASGARVSVYFVGTMSAIADVSRLARTDGRGTAAVVADSANVLHTAYRPDGLTVVLVRPDTSTTVHRHLAPGFRLEDELSALNSGPGATSGPAVRSPAPGTT